MEIEFDDIEIRYGESRLRRFLLEGFQPFTPQSFCLIPSFENIFVELDHYSVLMELTTQIFYRATTVVPGTNKISVAIITAINKEHTFITYILH